MDDCFKTIQQMFFQMICQFGKHLYVTVRRLPNMFTGGSSGYLGVCLWCISLWMHLWKISFIKIQKYVFTDSFGKQLWQLGETSFRKKTRMFVLCHLQEHYDYKNGMCNKTYNRKYEGLTFVLTITHILQNTWLDGHN